MNNRTERTARRAYYRWLGGGKKKMTDTKKKVRGGRITSKSHAPDQAGDEKKKG